MLVRGIVAREDRKVFDSGKVLRTVKVVENFENGDIVAVYVQVWGENGVDTSVGKRVELEVVQRSNRYTGKDGKERFQTKNIAVL